MVCQYNTLTTWWIILVIVSDPQIVLSYSGISKTLSLLSYNVFNTRPSQCDNTMVSVQGPHNGISVTRRPSCGWSFNVANMTPSTVSLTPMIWSIFYQLKFCMIIGGKHNETTGVVWFHLQHSPTESNNSIATSNKWNIQSFRLNVPFNMWSIVRP